MFYISLNEILKRWKSTLLMSLIIATMIFFTIVLISIYENDSGFYNNYKELFSCKGDVVAIEDMSMRNYGPLEEIEKKLVKVDHIYYNRWLVSQIDENLTKKGDLFIFGLDDIIMDYAPKMIEGVWVDKIDDDEKGIIPVVVSDDTAYKLGDYIKIRNPYDFSNWDTEEIQSVLILKVVGIYSDKSPVCYASSGLGWHINTSLEQYYISKVDLRDNVDFLFFTRKSIVEQADIDNAKYGTQIQNSQNFYIVKYQPDISDAEIAKNRSYWTTIDAYGINSFEEMNTLNYEKIRNKLTIFYPISIASFLLGIVAILTMCTITTRESMQTYAVLYAIGMRWNKAIFINTVQMVFSGTLGIVIAFGIYNILKITNKTGNIVMKTGLYQSISCIAIIIIIIVLSAISPIVILKKKQPTEVLRSTR